MAAVFKHLNVKNPQYLSDNIEIQTSQGNTIVLPSSRLYNPATPITPIARRPYNKTNNYEVKQSYVMDYNDPYVLNSFADAIVNREAKKRRYGEIFGSALFDFINTPVAMLDVLYNTTIAPIAAGIKGDDINFGEGLKTAGLNLLTNFGETMDIVANPVKGMVIEGFNAAKNNEDVWSAIGRGFVNSRGIGKEGRKNYDYDTGNVLADIVLESVSDPLTWFSLGLSSAVKDGAKGITSGVTKAALKGFKEIGEEVAQEGAEKIVKEVTQESAERLGKRLQRDLMNTFKDNVVDEDTVKTFLKSYAVNSTDDRVKLAARAALQNYTDETSKIVLDSLDKVKFTAAALRGEETFEKFLKGGVAFTSPLILWKGPKVGKEALNTVIQKRLIKEGIDNLPDYLVKYNILDETLSNVSDVTKKQIDVGISKYLVKKEVQILNNVRDVYTRVRMAFSEAVDGLVDEHKGITDYAALNQLLIDLESVENTLQSIFKNHSSELITDFKSYKTYIDSCVEAGFIPAQYSTVLKNLETFLNDAAQIKSSTQELFKPFGGTQVSKTAVVAFYETTFKKLTGLFKIPTDFKLSTKSVLELVDTPEAVNFNLRSLINTLSPELHKAVGTIAPFELNPMLNNLAKRVYALKEIFERQDVLKARWGAALQDVELLTDIESIAVKKIQLNEQLALINPKVQRAKKYRPSVVKTLTEISEETNPKLFEEYTRMLKEFDTVLQTEELYKAQLKYLELNLKLNRATQSFVSDVSKAHRLVLKDATKQTKLYSKISKLRVAPFVKDVKPKTKQATSVVNKNLKKILKNPTHRLPIETTKFIRTNVVDSVFTNLEALLDEHLDELDTFLDEPLKLNKGALRGVFTQCSDKDLEKIAEDITEVIEGFEAGALFSKHADSFELTRYNLARTAFDTANDNVAFIKGEKEKLCELIYTFLEEPIAPEAFLKDLKTILKSSINAQHELYNAVELFSKHLENAEVSKQYTDTILELLRREFKTPIKIMRGAGVEKGTTIYRMMHSMLATQDKLLNLNALRTLAEDVHGGVGYGAYLKQLAVEEGPYQAVAAELVSGLKAYYCFVHFFNNVFDSPYLNKVDENLKWGFLDAISGLKNVDPENLLNGLTGYMRQFEDAAIVNAIQHNKVYQKFNLEEGAKDYINSVIKELENKTDADSIALRDLLKRLNDTTAHDALEDCKRTAGLYHANKEIQEQINLSPDKIGIVIDLETSGNNAFADHIHQFGFYSLDGRYSGNIKAFAAVEYDDTVISALYKEDIKAGKSIAWAREQFNKTYRAENMLSETEALTKFINRIQEIEQTTGKRVVLLAHNGEAFDYKLLQNRITQLGLNPEQRAYFKNIRKKDTLLAWHRANGIARFEPEELKALKDLTQAYAVALQDCGSKTFGKLADGNMARALRTLAAAFESDKTFTGPKGIVSALRNTGDEITDTLTTIKSKFEKNAFIVFNKADEASPIMHALLRGSVGPSEIGLKTVVDFALESKYFNLGEADFIADHERMVGWARAIDRWRERIKSDETIAQFTTAELNKARKLLATKMPELFKARLKEDVLNPLTMFAQLKAMYAKLQADASYKSVEMLSESELLELLSPAFDDSRKDLVATLVKEISKNTETFETTYHYIDLNIDIMSENYFTGRTQSVVDSLTESFKLIYDDPVLVAGQTNTKTACKDLNVVLEHFEKEYTQYIPEPGKRASKEFIQRDKELRKGANVFGARSLERFRNQTPEEIYQELYLSGGCKCVAIPNNEELLPDTLIKGLRDKGVFVSEPVAQEYGHMYYIVADYDKLPKTAIPAFEETFDVLPSSPVLNEDLLKLRKKLYSVRPDVGCTAGDALTEQAMRNFHIGFMRDVVSKNPNAKKYLTSLDALHEAGFFKQQHANHLVVGGSSAKAALAPVEDMVFDETNNIFKKILNDVVQVYDKENKLINYLSLYFNDSMKLNSSPIWKDMSDDAIYNVFHLNRDNVCVVLKESKHSATGFEVVKFDLNSANAVARAKKAGAIIMPLAQYATLANTVNKLQINHPILKRLNVITNTYKAGYLASLGTIFRNAFSGVLNNYFTMDQPAGFPKTVKHWFQSLRDYYNYMSIIQDNTDDIIRIFNVRNTARQTTLLKELFNNKQITSMSAEYFREMHSFMQHQASGGLSEDLLKAMHIISDAAEDADPKFAKEYYKVLYSLLLVKQLGNLNNIVEHASRWSLYTMQIQNGATVNEAISAVIRTHFDYADKTYAQTIAEIFVPFMSFSMKNLEFYANLIEDCTWVLPVVRDFMTPIWNFDSMTAADEQLYESYDRHMELSDYAKLKAATPWTAIQTAQLYHMLAGNILLPLDRTAYKTYKDYNEALKKEIKNVYQVIKLNPAFMDAVTLITNPYDAVKDRLTVPIEYMGLFLRNLYEGKKPYEGFKLGDLPLVGPVLQRYGADKLIDPTVKTAVEKVEDSGFLLNAVIPSMFSTAYLNPTRVEDIKTPEQMQKFLYKQKMLYKKYNIDGGTDISQVYRNIRKNNMYPRKIKFKHTPTWKVVNTYKQPTERYQTYYTTQRNIDRLARSNVYERLYTPSGYSRMALNMGPTTTKNLKYRVAAIRNMFRYK